MNRKPIPKRRAKPRRGEPTKEEKEAVRRAVYNRDGQACVDCGNHVYWESGYFGSMHLMHIKSRGAGGDWSMENLLTGCPECHAKRHNCGGHPLPRKYHGEYACLELKSA